MLGAAEHQRIHHRGLQVLDEPGQQEFLVALFHMIQALLDGSSITDCWFGGSVSCNNIYSAVGGILGANFENFSGNKHGVIIKNCIVATKNITCAEPGNITWITAVVKTHVTDCIWPDRCV